MPAEAPDSTFKDRVTAKAYPVQELSGLVFAYLGPEPVPLLPHWDLLMRQDVFRHIGATVVPCNWLQIMENSLDPVHLEWLHGEGWSTRCSSRGPTPGRDRSGSTPRFRQRGLSRVRTRRSASTSSTTGSSSGASSRVRARRTTGGVLATR